MAPGPESACGRYDRHLCRCRRSDLVVARGWGQLGPLGSTGPGRASVHARLLVDRPSLRKSRAGAAELPLFRRGHVILKLSTLSASLQMNDDHCSRARFPVSRGERSMPSSSAAEEKQRQCSANVPGLHSVVALRLVSVVSRTRHDDSDAFSRTVVPGGMAQRASGGGPAIAE